MTWNIPIFLTWLRIGLIPIFTLMLYVPNNWLATQITNWIAACIFIVAGITDWLDGYLARKWHQTSDFGAFLDPIADKLMVAVALILLIEQERTPALYGIVIISREITISALREWMAQMGKRSSVAVASIGKFKTAAQMISIMMLLIYDNQFMGLNLILIGNLLMLIASILTIWSMCYYLKMAWKEFQ